MRELLTIDQFLFLGLSHDFRVMKTDSTRKDVLAIRCPTCGATAAHLLAISPVLLITHFLHLRCRAIDRAYHLSGSPGIERNAPGVERERRGK